MGMFILWINQKIPFKKGNALLIAMSSAIITTMSIFLFTDH